MLTALTCALLLCLPAPALAGQPHCLPGARTIAVEGQGEVNLPPTMGQATLTVEATAPSAAKALSQVSAATGRILEALKPKLAAEDRLTTEGYALFPIYEHDKRGRRSEATLAGYRGRSRLGLVVAGPRRLGALMDAAVAAGATGVSGIGFTNPAAGEAHRRAAASALKEARLLAESLAAEAGVKAGRLLKVTTVPEAGPGPIRFRGALGAAEAAAPPIEPGELKVRARVSAVYEIEEGR